MTLDEALDELYGAAPGRFTQERARLAKLLKDDERRDDAAALAKTRKPVLAAWALNQLPREAREQVDALLDAGSRLRDAQKAVLEGAERDVFERARRDEQQALAGLLREAEQLLRREGEPSAAIVDQVRESLRAAAIGAEGRDLLARGRFTAPIRLEGFGLVSELAPAEPPPRAARSRRDDDAASRRRDDAEAKRALREARSRLREAEAAAAKAARAADELSAQAEAARREADAADPIVEAAAAAVAEAEARRERRP